MLYDLVVQIIGTVPIEFEFIYGLVTIVASLFGVLLIFSPVILCIKLVRD